MVTSHFDIADRLWHAQFYKLSDEVGAPALDTAMRSIWRDMNHSRFGWVWFKVNRECFVALLWTDPTDPLLVEHAHDIVSAFGEEVIDGERAAYLFPIALVMLRNISMASIAQRN